MHAEAYLKFLALAAALAVMPAALADPGELVSVTYGDMSGGFVAGDATRTFGDFDVVIDLTKQATPNLTATRLVPGTGSALFNEVAYGTYTLTLADFTMHMDVTNITASAASASGSFVITDTAGATLSGSLSGTWTKGGTNHPFFREHFRRNVQCTGFHGRQQYIFQHGLHRVSWPQPPAVPG